MSSPSMSHTNSPGRSVNPTTPSAIWRFRLTPRDGGTNLTYWMQMGPGRSGLSVAIESMPDKEQKIVFVRHAGVRGRHR